MTTVPAHALVSVERPLISFDQLIAPFLAAADAQGALLGRDIRFVTNQIRGHVPHLAAMAPRDRALYPISLRLPDGREVKVKAGDLPDCFRAVGLALRAPKLLRAPTDSFVRVEKEVHQTGLSDTSAWDGLFADLSSWIQEPGNREKEVKYIFAMDAVSEALDRKFPRWKETFLNDLAKEIPNSPFAKHAYCALRVLSEHTTREEPTRALYGFVQKNLRQALQLLEEEEGKSLSIFAKAREILLYFCHAKFTKVWLYPHYERFVSHCLFAPQPGDADRPFEIPVFTFERLSAEIRRANRRLRTVPSEYGKLKLAREADKLKGATGVGGFDPNNGSNVPWCHSHLRAVTDRGVKECKVLRFGTPTTDCGGIWGASLRGIQYLIGRQQSGHARVIEEFRAFLQAAQDAGETILYVNHQEFDPSGRKWVGPESDRARAIHALEKSFDNFHFMSLPLDGELWRDEFLEASSLSQLKAHLLQMKYPVEQTTIQDILNGVEELYFGRRELSIGEKKAFVMLFYSELKDCVKNIYGADYIVSACKDHKDRGNASVTVDMVKNLVKLGLENNPEKIQEVYFSVLGPYIIKNQHIEEERLDLALHVIDVLAGLTDAQKALIRERSLTGYQIREQIVPKEVRTWAQMVPVRKFSDLIANMRRLDLRSVYSQHDFQQELSRDFLEDGVWNLQKLKRQITNDLIDRDGLGFWLNDAPVYDFGDLCVRVGLNPALFNGYVDDASLTDRQRKALRFISMYQQGIGALMMRDPSLALNLGAKRLVVTQPVPVGLEMEVIRLIRLHRKNSPEAKGFAQRCVERNVEFVRYLKAAVSEDLLPDSYIEGLNAPLPLPKFFFLNVRGAFNVDTGEREMHIEQRLVFREPGPSENRPEMIQVTGSLREDGPAVISWRFE